MANTPTPTYSNNLGLRASRGGETAPATALADLPTDHSYLDIPAFLRRQAD
jgi:cell division protein FtsZ